MPLVNVSNRHRQLTAYIGVLKPEHWWKHDEASGSLADSGTVGGLEMSSIGGAQTYAQAGPTSESSAIDYTPAGHFRRASVTQTFQSGTILVMYDTDSLGSAPQLLWSTMDSGSNETDMLAFGFGSIPTGTLGKRFSIQRINTTSDYSIIHANSDISEPSPGTAEWHCLIATSDGAAVPLLYDNGSLVATTTLESGWGGAAGDWLADMGSDALVFGNGRYSATATSNISGDVSHMAVWDRVLSAAEIANINSYI